MTVGRQAWFGKVYERGITGQNRCAITFDDGPLEGATDDVLDILGAAQARATFFVIGENARRWPKLIERMHDEGHVVANHTWSHSHFSMMRGVWYWRREIDLTDKIIRYTIGQSPAWFRPPMGVRTPINMGVLRQTGHACIMWTRRGMDGVKTTPDKILGRFQDKELQDGSVLLLHDGREPHSRRDPTPTLQALPDLLKRCRDAGLVITPLQELLGIDPYQPHQPPV